MPYFHVMLCCALISCLDHVVLFVVPCQVFKKMNMLQLKHHSNYIVLCHVVRDIHVVSSLDRIVPSHDRHKFKKLWGSLQKYLKIIKQIKNGCYSKITLTKHITQDYMDISIYLFEQSINYYHLI
jgi:hypothetical protein